MSCEIKLQKNMLYTVILREQFLIFFVRTKFIYKNLTRSDVKKLKIPFVMFITSGKKNDPNNYHNYLFPRRIL